jgi:hypothetical protein
MDLNYSSKQEGRRQKSRWNRVEEQVGINRLPEAAMGLYLPFGRNSIDQNIYSLGDTNHNYLPRSPAGAWISEFRSNLIKSQVHNTRWNRILEEAMETEGMYGTIRPSTGSPACIQSNLPRDQEPPASRTLSYYFIPELYNCVYSDRWKYLIL